MKQQVEKIFNQSYERINGAPTSFFELFYDKFLVFPHVAEKFLDTDFLRQRLMLRQSLLGMVEFFIRGREDEEVRQLSNVHKKHHIPPELYDIWLQSLIETVQQCDPQFDLVVEHAWRTVLAPGIAYMKEEARRAQTAVNTDTSTSNT